MTVTRSALFRSAGTVIAMGSAATALVACGISNAAPGTPAGSSASSSSARPSASVTQTITARASSANYTDCANRGQKLPPIVTWDCRQTATSSIVNIVWESWGRSEAEGSGFLVGTSGRAREVTVKLSKPVDRSFTTLVLVGPDGSEETHNL